MVVVNLTERKITGAGPVFELTTDIPLMPVQSCFDLKANGSCFPDQTLCRGENFPVVLCREKVSKYLIPVPAK